MVAVTHSISQSASPSSALALLSEGLLPEDVRRVADAHEWAQALYADRSLGTREPVWPHALGTALIVASLRLDADARIAALSACADVPVLIVRAAEISGLAERIGDRAVKVAESGIGGTEDVARLAAEGADVILVGEALVKHGDPRSAIGDFMAAGKG